MHQKKAYCVLSVQRIGLTAIALITTSPSFATTRREYQAVVTNVLDGNTVVISERIFPGMNGFFYPLTIRLNGIEAPELDAPGGMEAREMLEKLALNEKFYFSELFDTGKSHGA